MRDPRADINAQGTPAAGMAGADVSHETESVALDSLPLDDEIPDGALLPGTRIAERYVLAEPLGRGGYGVVYRATDSASGETLALKILRADRASTSAARRFAREAVAARRVTHPNLVRVLDSGEDEGRLWIAMELVGGESLKARLARGPLSVPEVARLGREILDALQALHDAGIVHRDVKPGNILLDRDGRARLGDLGLVTQLDADESQATQTGALVGTLAYLSPEIALGRPVTARSDLYSLGITLYEALSGEPPHQGTTSLGTVIARITTELPGVETLRRDVPTWLSRIIARLVEREPTDRYASARDAARDLATGRFTPTRNPRRARRVVVAVAAGIVGAALLLWAATAGRREARPALVAAEVRAGLLRALDSSGRLLWEKRFEAPYDDSSYLPPAGDAAARLRVVDTDGDGVNEILLVAQDNEDKVNTLTAYESDGGIRYSIMARHEVRYGTQAFTSFNIGGTFAFKDDFGRTRLFVIANHVSYFPSVLEEIDPQGRSLAEYWSSGQALWVSPIRFQSRAALAIGGYGNETHGASLSIVALDDIAGRAPAADPRYRCVDCPSLRAPLRYIMFPSNDVTRGLTGGQGSASTTATRPTDRGIFDVMVESGRLKTASGRLVFPRIGYRLDANFTRLDNLTPGPEHLIAHDILRLDGRVDHYFGERDLAELSQVRVWTGTGYEALPAVETRKRP